MQRQPQTSLNYHNLPPAILSLFAPRKPLPFLPPIERKEHLPYSSVGTFLDCFEEPKEDEVLPEWKMPESRRQKRERIEKEKNDKMKQKLQEDLMNWDPNLDEKIKGEPENTLFIGRLVKII